MCGIAGIISIKVGEVRNERLKSMTDSISHRGPDGEGQWISDDLVVGLAHRRLSIIDISEAGKQPMHYLNRYHITFNGEIYNYVELRELCIKKGYTFLNHTDTEIIMAMYDWMKEGCLQYFDGMFAFALYDDKEKRVFVAKDRFGEKPFYYNHLPGQSFIFSSEMKSLWAGGIKREINNKMLYNYLSFKYIDNPSDNSETFFHGIKKLPHSHYIIIDTTNLSCVIKKYWDINCNNIDYSISVDQARSRFEELFYTSVNRRLRSDVPVGSSLSGGLDSSAVVAVIDEINKEKSLRQTTFSAVFPGFEKDESKYMKMLLSTLNVEPHFTAPTADTMLNELGKCFHHQEEPFGSASILAQYEVQKLAKQKNVTVLLDGQGADELLAGYHPFYHFFFKEIRIRNKSLYQREIAAYEEMHGANNINPLPKKDLKHYIRKWSGPAHGILKDVFNRYQQFSNPYLNSDFFNAHRKDQYRYPRPANSLNQALYNSVNEGMTQLLRYADRNSMAHSREVRLPFLYHELVEFLFTLPSDMKIHNGWTKYLQRLTFEKKLPPEITWRKDKIGYEPPQKKWMENDRVKEVIMNIRQELVAEKILHPSILKRKVEGAAAHEDVNNNWNHLMVAFLYGKGL
jgi:asparagine synthase (glutamine-hydrolysing)